MRQAAIKDIRGLCPDASTEALLEAREVLKAAQRRPTEKTP
jgi:hypothetical protein